MVSLITLSFSKCVKSNVQMLPNFEKSPIWGAREIIRIFMFSELLLRAEHIKTRVTFPIHCNLP